MKTPPSNSVLNAELAAILSANSNKKLLSFWDAASVMACLLLHPSPREMVRQIVRQRPVEDLLVLPYIIGFAGQVIRRNDPSITEAALVDRVGKLMPILRAESPEYEIASRTVPARPEKSAETRMLVDGFIGAYDKPGFDDLDYAASHPGLLSLAVDHYLVAMSINSKAPADKIDGVIDAIWVLRVALFDCRNRLK